jgi:predicted ribosome quality control (RQC) complex YloA/Tae2 family protein
VSRPEGERALCLDVDPTGETEDPLRLNLLLFGSLGRAELVRGDSVLQFVGGRFAWKPNENPEHAPAPTAAAAGGRDAVETCRETGESILADARRRIVRTRLSPIRRKLAAQRRLLAKLEGELERAAGHEQVRREAETLAAFQTRIEQGAATVDLPDVYAPDETLRIDLDPAAPVRVQIEKRFKRAAKLERSETHTRRRIEEVRGEISALDAAVDAVDSAAGFTAAMVELDRLLDALPRLRPQGARFRRDRAPTGATPFRRYDLDDTWFVLVGRSNQENDELTFHAAAPTDLWFHAQHVPGSHVVLKCSGNPGSPPAHILERTAAIAAHYSKARHSGLAPVIYTQRKYVRKPRGAKAGQVVCEREKTLIVEPGLPDNSNP